MSGILSIQEMERYVEKNLDNALQDLFNLVKIPTVTAKGGEHSSEAITQLEKIFHSLGFNTSIFETTGQPVFTAEYNKNKPKTLLFYNHYDVQPAEPFDLWTSPPFDPQIREEKIYGRGVADNKGEIVVRASAIKMIQQLQGELPVNVKFVIEGEEETSSVHLAEYIQSNQDFIKADGCIWEFGGKNFSGLQQIWAGIKGICYVQLKTSGPKKDIHSAAGAAVKNPANHLVAALASLRDDKTDEIRIENYYDPIVEPSKETIDAIIRLKDEFDEEKTKREYGIDEFIRGLTGVELLKKYYLSPTCTICGIWSGWQGAGGKTVLPAEAHAKLDFRLVPNQTPEDVIQKLRQHFKKHEFDVEIEWFNGYRPAYTPLSDPFVHLLKETMTDVYGNNPLVHPWSPGSGPLYLFADHLPVLSIGVGNPGSNSHSPNENIEVEDFKRGQICIARLMEKMAES
ncbi:MAG: M20/M25/M40 family metallo-hydrolase [Candidatus Hodarchaeales archaeon]